MSAQSDAVLRIAVERDNERTHRNHAERALRIARERLTAVERLCDRWAGLGCMDVAILDVRAALAAAVEGTETP
jgi:hypothetical protein